MVKTKGILVAFQGSCEVMNLNCVIKVKCLSELYVNVRYVSFYVVRQKQKIC